MEIFIGTDIVENKRIEKALNKFGNRFLDKVYTKTEKEYCFKQKNYIQCLAARFAAKEACIKAYFQAFKETLYFNQIEVLGKKGHPAEILLHLSKKPDKPYVLRVSLSHEIKFSIATVLIYTY